MKDNKTQMIDLEFAEHSHTQLPAQGDTDQKQTRVLTALLLEGLQLGLNCSGWPAADRL